MWMYGGLICRRTILTYVGRTTSSRRTSFVGRFVKSAQVRKLHSSSQDDAGSQDQHGLLADLEMSVYKRLEQAGFRRSRRFYWVVAAITFAAVVGVGYLYFFPHKLREQVVEEVSTVASKSLEDEKIVSKAEQLSKDIVTGVLNDEQTKQITSDFVKDIIVSQPTKEAAVDTIVGLLNDEKVLSLLRQRLSEIILSILQQESTRQVVMSQVNVILMHESVQASLGILLHHLVNTPEIKALMADFFKDVLASDAVRDQGKRLGQQVTTDVITSSEIQEQAGNALWSALKYSVIPNVLRGKKDALMDADNGSADNGEGPAQEVGPTNELEKLNSNKVLQEDNSPLYYDNRYNIDDDLEM